MPETTELMKRPSESDEFVLRRAMELFKPEVVSYLGEDYSEKDWESTAKDIKSVLSSNRDGYEMAREFEHRYHWAEDRGLMDLMDEGESYLRQAHKELLTQWIKCYGISPERKVGDVVSSTHWHRKGQVGEIKKIYEDRAEYAVHFPDQPASSAAILRYEDVIDAPIAVEEPA